MVRYTNPSGYVKYATEEELCKELEQKYLKTILGHQWKPRLDITKEVWISPNDRIDYANDERTIFIEVKNWWVTHKEIKQILRYKEILENKKLIIICGGIEDYRKKILEEKHIEITIVKDIQEINPGMVASWV